MGGCGIKWAMSLMFSSSDTLGGRTLETGLIEIVLAYRHPCLRHSTASVSAQLLCVGGHWRPWGDDWEDAHRQFKLGSGCSTRRAFSGNDAFLLVL